MNSLLSLGCTPPKKSRPALFCKLAVFSAWMLTKKVWLIKKLKNRVGLLIFCGGCADQMSLSQHISVKKAFLSKTEGFGSFLLCFFYSNLALPSAKNLQNGRFWFLLSLRKIEPVTTHKMASHLMDMNIIF